LGWAEGEGNETEM
jgi:hypothetical protein